MKQIGEFLKQKRLEKGYTIDQIVDKTRMPSTRIKAIEEGDISLFKDDLTYVQYFVQAYCKALDVDYKELKDKVNDSVNGYTTAFHANQLKSIVESEQNIRDKSNQRIEQYKNKTRPKKVNKKIDFSLISFILVVCLLVGCVVFVGGKFIVDKMNQPEPPIAGQPNNPVYNPDDKPQIDKPETPVVKKELEVVQTEGSYESFDVLNATEPFIVKIQFVPSSHFELLFDGELQPKPQRRIYDAGTVLEIEVDPTMVKEVTLNFGYFWKMKVSVDEKELTFDDSIALHKGRKKIVLNIKGE